jgi:hypothetical protein
MRSSRRTRRIVLFVVLFDIVSTIVARRLGYGVGGKAIVRCRRGHLFTTIWLPGASLKSIRLGWWRIQRCPVGPHWSVVSPVRVADLTDDEKVSAGGHRDIRIP